MIRILTYNVHSCIGSDRKVDPARIAEVVAECRPDIIALQELDVRRARTGGIDQAHAIASHLDMVVHFHPALHVEEEQYGDAILTALPVRLVKAGPLPSLGEARGAIWVSVKVDGIELQVINTHLGLSRRERLNQVAALLGPTWLGDPACTVPRILLGDFNAVPRSAAYRRLSDGMKDAQSETPSRRPRPTFPARLPLLRIDHIFLDGSIEMVDVRVHGSRLARTASDHLPLSADLQLA
jgi:endonuclease/exonuclease/phosphatase family metal-dependent hydrolase